MPEKSNTPKKKQTPFPMQHRMTDPQGMYTGVPEDPFEYPIQDADDL